MAVPQLINFLYLVEKIGTIKRVIQSALFLYHQGNSIPTAYCMTKRPGGGGIAFITLRPFYDQISSFKCKYQICAINSFSLSAYRGCSAYTEPQRLVSSDGLQMLTCKHSYQCDSNQICINCVCAAKCTYSSNCTKFQVCTRTPVLFLSAYFN